MGNEPERDADEGLSPVIKDILLQLQEQNEEMGCSEKFEIFNLDMKVGDTLKVKGKISGDAEGFSINLGSSSSDLALHFNPRFTETVVVCNSRCGNAWQAEHRDRHFCFSRDSTVKLIIEFLRDKFKVTLPDDHHVEFPNRHNFDKLKYMSIKGGFRVTSFKLD